MKSDRLLHRRRQEASQANAVLLGLCIAAILFMTITPTPETGGESAHFLCVLCNPYALSDALRNVLLFVPLGIVLSFRNHKVLFVILLGTILSMAIELTQLAIPGRFPSLQDICSNSVGTLVGVGIGRAFLRPVLTWILGSSANKWRPHFVSANALAVGAILLAVSVFTLTAVLLSPAFPIAPYLIAGKELNGGTAPLRIGGTGDETGFYKGAIDEVRLYNRALSPDEIRSDMGRPTTDTLSPSAVSGLIAAYGFDEKGGARVQDASGLNNNGLVKGAVRAAGKFGNAMIFDGRHDQVIIPYSPVLDLKRSFTLSAWVRPEKSHSPWPAVVQKQGDHYFLYAGAYLADSVPNGGGTFGGANEGVVAPAPLVLSVWTHLATTYDGSALRIYVNGRNVATLLRWFGGHITKMAVGNTEVRPGFINPVWMRQALEAGETIGLRGTLGPTQDNDGALLDIMNRRHINILKLVVEGTDLILNYHTVAASLGLHSPNIRYSEALQELTPGSLFTVGLSGTPNARVVTVNGTKHVGQGLSLGMGWTVLMYSDGLPQWLGEIINLLWIATWTFLAGFWLQNRLTYIGAIVILGCSLLILPLVGSLVPTPPAEWAVAILGFLAGHLAGSRRKNSWSKSATVEQHD